MENVYTEKDTERHRKLMGNAKYSELKVLPQVEQPEYLVKNLHRTVVTLLTNDYQIIQICNLQQRWDLSIPSSNWTIAAAINQK